MNERGQYASARAASAQPLSNAPGIASIVTVVAGIFLVRHWVKR
jgi:hypothetical protein